MALAVSSMCLCLLCTTSFCCGVCGHELWWIIPWLLNRSLYYALKNSPPLQDLSTLLLLPNCALTIMRKFLSIKQLSDFKCIKNTQVHLEWSSTKVRKCLILLCLATLYGPIYPYEPNQTMWFSVVSSLKRKSNLSWNETDITMIQN